MPPSIEVTFGFEAQPVGVLSREGEPTIREAEHLPLPIIDQLRFAAFLQHGQFEIIEEFTLPPSPLCHGELGGRKALSYRELPGVLGPLMLVHQESLRLGPTFSST
jgi:hypothetical protein